VAVRGEVEEDGTAGRNSGWGAADGDYATKNGPQMRTIMNMVTALGD
jgi:hypothetical protein